MRVVLTFIEIKGDAVNIYSKYIALECSSDLGISEELRNSTISK